MKETSRLSPSPPSPNGQITNITDNVDGGRSTSYAYDSLERLSTAATSGSSGYPAWGLSMTYDRYGNRTLQNVTAGSAPYNSVSVDATTNRINTSGYSYDSNGNMTNDGANSLLYDAENHLVSVGAGNANYYYDGKNLRVKKVNGSTTTVYIFSGSKVIAEYDNGAAVGSPSREYLYAGGGLLARIDGGSTTRYYHQDHLSNRVVTNSSGSVLEQKGHFPFGEDWYQGSDKLKFTTYERDSESGNDYALARYNVNRLARFSSPDPLSGTIFHPQSLNRYTYAANDPCNMVDPLGRATCTFNFHIDNQLNLTPQRLSAIQNQIKGIFSQKDDGNGNKVDVTFDSSQPADVTIKYKDSAWYLKDSWWGHEGANDCPFGYCIGQPAVYVDHVSQDYSWAQADYIERALGTVGAHESVHRLLDSPESKDVCNLMGNALNAGRAPGACGTQLSQQQIAQLFIKCISKHPPKNNNTPGGGGGGVPDGGSGSGGLGGGESIWDQIMAITNALVDAINSIQFEIVTVRLLPPPSGQS